MESLFADLALAVQQKLTRNIVAIICLTKSTESHSDPECLDFQAEARYKRYQQALVTLS